MALSIWIRWLWIDWLSRFLIDSRIFDLLQLTDSSVWISMSLFIAEVTGTSTVVCLPNCCLEQHDTHISKHTHRYITVIFISFIFSRFVITEKLWDLWMFATVVYRSEGQIVWAYCKSDITSQVVWVHQTKACWQLSIMETLWKTSCVCRKWRVNDY